jgi:uncharacterized membrane protein
MPSDGDFRFYTPLVLPLWLLFLFLGGVVFVLIGLHVVAAGFAKLGLSSGQVLLILGGSFLGSAINIPIKRFESETRETVQVRSFFGMRYRLPVRRRSVTVVAVNVGGCLIPVGVSLYLLARMPSLIPAAAVSIAVCSVVTYSVSRVVPGMGIATPWFLPPAASAILAIILAPSGLAAPVAYATGSLGTLIGADLLNLGKIKKMGAPVASIGGAGTWDGIFLSALLASLLTF